MKALLFLIVVLFISGCTVVDDFESCVKAGNPVMESYPRQCTHNGVTYVEFIETEWWDDAIWLMQHEIDGYYGCFGCNDMLCVDPVPEMVQVDETSEMYCSSEFEIIGLSKEEICENAGGMIKEFPNSCGDSCEVNRYPEVISCAAVITDACDCGAGKCWNGNSCENI